MLPMASLPVGTVTFLFSDIEGSTRLLQQLGDRYGELVSKHRRVIRESAADAGGTEIDAQGDALFFSFPRARDAVSGALAAQLGLGAERWPGEAEVKVRMGLHTGEPTLGEEGYLGLDVVRGARIASAAHGGQVLVSETTRALLPADLSGGAEIIDLGQHSLKDLERAEHLFQVVAPGLRSDFPPPRADPAGGHKEDLERRIDEFVNRGLSSVFERFDLEKMESGRWLLKRRDDRTT
jgi:class 3 adenylate cyclase